MHDEGFWAALVCEPAKEYLACSELQRFGLHPYLPQYKRQWTAPRTTGAKARRFPLFANYLLLSLDEAEHPLIHEARGLRRFPVLRYGDGTAWRAPAHVIDAVRAAEAKGEFDEHAPGRGDKVTMRKGVFSTIEAIIGRSQSAKTFELLLPLFNSSVRATVAQSAVMRA